MDNRIAPTHLAHLWLQACRATLDGDETEANDAYAAAEDAQDELAAGRRGLAQARLQLLRGPQAA